MDPAASGVPLRITISMLARQLQELPSAHPWHVQVKYHQGRSGSVGGPVGLEEGQGILAAGEDADGQGRAGVLQDLLHQAGVRPVVLDYQHLRLLVDHALP